MGRGGPVREAHWGRGAKPLSIGSEESRRGSGKGVVGSLCLVSLGGVGVR